MQESSNFLKHFLDLLFLTFSGRLFHGFAPRYLKLFLRYSVFGNGRVNLELSPLGWYGFLSHVLANWLLRYVETISLRIFNIIIALCLVRLISRGSHFNCRRISQDLMS